MNAMGCSGGKINMAAVSVKRSIWKKEKKGFPVSNANGEITLAMD